MKKRWILLLALVLCLGLAGCGTVYEDTNGEDVYTLETITDEEIIGLKTGSSGLNYTEESLGDLAFSSEYSAKNFNGVEQIYLTNLIGPSDVSIYIGNLNVKSGNFKLVAINNDEIIKEFDLDTFNEEFFFEDIKGSFAIHVAGESAAFSFDLEVR